MWLRANASAPWVLDVPLTPAANGGRWTNKHLDGHVATVEEVTWVAEDGIRYLLPEIVLVFKARLRRPKDEPELRGNASDPHCRAARVDAQRGDQGHA